MEDPQLVQKKVTRQIGYSRSTTRVKPLLFVPEGPDGVRLYLGD